MGESGGSSDRHVERRADGVLRRAVETGASKARGLDKEAVEQLLRVAFCCLAQLDDRGNVVRDFATLDQMLAASGVYERQPDRQKECRGALQAALAVFERATLINVGTNYDVNHEAFIRGWTTYKDWLKEAQHLRERLVDVDRSIRNDHTDRVRVRIPELVEAVCSPQPLCRSLCAGARIRRRRDEPRPSRCAWAEQHLQRAMGATCFGTRRGGSSGFQCHGATARTAAQSGQADRQQCAPLPRGQEQSAPLAQVPASSGHLRGSDGWSVVSRVAFGRVSRSRISTTSFASSGCKVRPRPRLTGGLAGRLTTAWYMPR